ncbi:hypothetical protein RB620_10815 [Paenibacillus sp. LHD-117]|uniref:hypothetical protein n=1 Tax=Paenibacillus sp. LHD-117 TaxID=3071412 RepID=UPI0027E06E26|nr:hypothetical protein [Paenibacillus sp. LHD-117]MDQ6419925.1 hypothetical protein [Paenibacillus sp. LHD-117]
MKKIISLMLTIAILFVTATASVGADASIPTNIPPTIPAEGITKDYLKDFTKSFNKEYLNENPEFAAALNELKKLLQTEETDVRIIEKQLLQTESMKKLAMELGDTETLTLSAMNSPESQEQLKRIDDLAQEFYKQYELTGILPETTINQEVLAVAEDREYGNDDVYSVSTGDAVIALSTVGVVETEARLATRLVTLGALSTLDGPLPVADLICLVVGISLLWHHTATKLSSNSTAVSNQIGTYYGSQAKTKAIGVMIGSATITAQVKQGWNHFVAYLFPVKPGGITLGRNMTFVDAAEHLKKNLDVWSIGKNTAKTLAANISYGTGPYDEVHNTNGWFMNRPHWHARVLGVRVGGHSFW